LPRQTVTSASFDDSLPDEEVAGEIAMEEEVIHLNIDWDDIEPEQ